MSLMLDQVGVLADFQQVYGQLAASCSAMADAVAFCSQPHQVFAACALVKRDAAVLHTRRCRSHVQNVI